MSVAVVAGDVVTVAEVCARLGLSGGRVWDLAAEGVLDRAGRGLVTAASVDREVARRAERAVTRAEAVARRAERADMVAGGSAVTVVEAAARLGVSVQRVVQLVAAGRLDRGARWMLTAASVDREVARRAERAAS